MTKRSSSSSIHHLTIFFRQFKAPSGQKNLWLIESEHDNRLRGSSYYQETDEASTSPSGAESDFDFGRPITNGRIGQPDKSTHSVICLTPIRGLGHGCRWSEYEESTRHYQALNWNFTYPIAEYIHISSLVLGAKRGVCFWRAFSELAHFVLVKETASTRTKCLLTLRYTININVYQERSNHWGEWETL